MRTERKLNEKGLTLIEILAVIVILEIIAAIPFSSIQSVIQNQRDKALMSEIVNMFSLAKIAHMDNECEN